MCIRDRHKPKGGLRPMSILSAWRRVFLTTATRALRDRVAEAAGHRQFATSPGGADTQYKVLQAGVDLRGDKAV
eukprot:8474989-Prorocentrum_lima.AAC.1